MEDWVRTAQALGHTVVQGLCFTQRKRWRGHKPHGWKQKITGVSLQQKCNFLLQYVFTVSVAVGEILTNDFRTF